MRKIWIVVAVLVLAACSSIERRDVDGVDCVVVKKTGDPQAVSCDWDRAKERKNDDQ